jgi:uncharacterized protein
MPPRYVPEARPQGPVVQGFSGNGFRIGDLVFSRGLWLTPERADDWDAPPLAALTEAVLAPLLGIAPAPEFLLLGTGATTRPPPPALAVALDARGIGIEPMDSRTAARTWGMLRGESRWIVAALLPLA